MSELINRLETVVKEMGLTFNRVEHDCKLGNGTIKRWGNQSPRLDKLVIVAEYLNVSLDYLVFGTHQSESSPNRDDSTKLDSIKKELSLICDGIPLNEDEIDLVAIYRLLPPSHKEELFDLAYFKYKRYVEQKKESIYSVYFEENKSTKKDNDEENSSASSIA